jgi:hypothetical protein
MNEQIVRDVVLVRAIEVTDHKREILSDDDRMYASRSAKELAQWQAHSAGTEVTLEHFLQQRSEQILKRISERTPAFASFLKHRERLRGLIIALPVLALIFGIGMDRIGDPHRVDLLSAPLLAIIGWNLLVYVSLVASLFFPSGKASWRHTGLLRALNAGKTAVPRKLPHTLSAALFAFMAEWAELSGRLTQARLSRTIHLSAALFAAGAMLSLYARGFLTQYVAGWESTFLDAVQVHAILSLLFMPAASLFSLQGFSIADIEALRFGQSHSVEGGARWVNLYAATLFLLVVLPRLILALVANWRVTRLVKNFPLDLQQPYFRKLNEKLGGIPAVLRVLPYSFTLDEVRQKGLNEIAVQLLGEQARVLLRPPFAYGEEPREALGNTSLEDATESVTAVLFNLAATPENENHGLFLDFLVHESARPVTVLIDESGYQERAGKERNAQRVALWREFCNFHHAPATIVNLLDPQAHQLHAETP